MPNHHKKGFASMSAEQKRKIASLGGKAAQATGRCHRFTREEASQAGKKGGAKVVAVHGIDHFAAIGKKGGLSRQAQARAKREAES